MAGLRLNAGFARLDSLEVQLCLPINALASNHFVSSYFRLISRLGDWPLWVSMLFALPLIYGPAAWPWFKLMATTAIGGIGLYKLLKHVLVRERPFASHPEVQLIGVPIDRYSFPSGHTLQATCFMVMLAYSFPAVMWVLLPLAISIAVSRVVLGLHYPSDVLAGALIGFILAKTSLLLSGMVV